MNSIEARKIATVHSYISEYARWNLDQAIAESVAAEVVRLKRLSAPSSESVPPRSPSSLPKGGRRKSPPPRTGRKDPMENYRGVNPASILVYFLESQAPAVIEIVKKNTTEERRELLHGELVLAAEIVGSVPPSGFRFEWRRQDEAHNMLGRTIQTLGLYLGTSVVSPLLMAAEGFAALVQKGKGKTRQLQFGLISCAKVMEALCDLLRSAGQVRFLPTAESRSAVGTLEHVTLIEMGGLVRRSESTIRAACKKAEINRPARGKHHYKFLGPDVSAIARARKQMGAKPEEIARWEELLARMSQPLLRFPLRAKPQSKPRM